ncbi:MAG: TIGR04222 domain-containing membrane protein, partial [Mesorhizobium sp.]
MSDITAGSAARDPYWVGRSGGHGHGGHGHGGHGHAGHGHG